MASVAQTNVPIQLGAVEQTYNRRFQWMVPVLIGLSAPLIFGLLTFPTLLEDARPVIAVMLSGVVIVCGAAAAIALILRGDAVGAIVNGSEQKVDVLFENMFATSVKTYAFSDIADFHAQERRDRDGYSYTGANIVMTDGKTISILASLSADEISAARRVMGIRGRAR
jgi:hypothetical protein